MKQSLPDQATMYRALLDRDNGYEGIFIVGVKTTGIFCRPTCTARKPKKENIEFFSSIREALQRGYRPCKICNPMGYRGEIPGWLMPIMDEINALRSEMVKECVHPIDDLVYKETHIECKFCNGKIGVPSDAEEA